MILAETRLSSFLDGYSVDARHNKIHFGDYQISLEIITET